MSNWYIKELSLISAAVVLSVCAIFVYDRFASGSKHSASSEWDAQKGTAGAATVKAPPVVAGATSAGSSAGTIAQAPRTPAAPSAPQSWDEQVATFLEIDGNPAWPVQGLALWSTCTGMTKSKASAAPPALDDLCARMAGNGVAFVRTHLQGPSRNVALLVADELRRAHGLLSPRQLIDIDPRGGKVAKPANAASNAASRSVSTL